MLYYNSPSFMLWKVTIITTDRAIIRRTLGLGSLHTLIQSVHFDRALDVNMLEYNGVVSIPSEKIADITIEYWGNKPDVQYCNRKAIKDYLICVKGGKTSKQTINDEV